MKLPNGFGTIYKLSGKRRKPWRAAVTSGWEYDEEKDKLIQKRTTLGYYATRQEALTALTEFNRQPFDLSSGSCTFQELYDRWSAEKYPAISRSNKNGYISAYKSCEMLYDKKFRELKLSHLQDVITHSDKGYPSLLRIRGLYIQLYDYAIKHDICARDYSRYVTVPKKQDNAHKRFPHRKFEAGEIQQLWEHSGIYTIDIILLLIYSGVRISELLDLRKEHVHLEERYFQVIASKTENGIRIVPIAEKVVPVWQHFLASSSEFAICSPAGKKIVYRTYHDSFKKSMQDLQMSHRIHDTRHTCISMLTQANVNPSIIKTIVGHAGAMSLTERVYTHLDTSLLIEAINKI